MFRRIHSWVGSWKGVFGYHGFAIDVVLFDDVFVRWSVKLGAEAEFSLKLYERLDM